MHTQSLALWCRPGTFHCRCLVLICSVHEIEFRVWFVITIDAGAGLQASHCFALAEGVCLFRASSPQQTLLMALERKRERESERGSERERERAREICDLCVCPPQMNPIPSLHFFKRPFPRKNPIRHLISIGENCNMFFSPMNF